MASGSTASCEPPRHAPSGSSFWTCAIPAIQPEIASRGGLWRLGDIRCLTNQARAEPAEAGVSPCIRREPWVPGPFPQREYPPPPAEWRSSFVTLSRVGHLRGCCGRLRGRSAVDRRRLGKRIRLGISRPALRAAAGARVRGPSSRSQCSRHSRARGTSALMSYWTH